MNNEKFEIVERAELPENIIKALNGDSETYNTLINTENRNEIIKSIITGKTPERFIRTREGTKGKIFKYVPQGYFKKSLNMMFGLHGWNTDVKQILTRELKDGKIDIAVVVRLEVCYIVDGKEIWRHKEQAGSAKAFAETEYGDALKAAISDGLKKCCSDMGIAGDVYGQSEEELTGNKDDENNTPKYNKGQLDAALTRLEGKLIDGTVTLEEIERAYNFLQVTKFNDLIMRARTLLENFKKNEQSA